MTDTTGRDLRVGILVGGLALVVGLGAAELGLRLLWPVGNAVQTAAAGIYAPDAELGWTLRPDLRVTRPWAGREIEIRTDRAGRRVPARSRAPGEGGAPPPAEGPSPARGSGGAADAGAIPFGGDSYVFGNEVQAEETFVHRVGERLGVPTVNLGVGGYGLGQAASALVRHLGAAGGGAGRRVPLAVLVLYVGNDLEYGAWPRSGIRVDEDGFLVRGEGTPGDPAGGWLRRAARTLVVHSRLAFLVARGWSEIRRRFGPPVDTGAADAGAAADRRPASADPPPSIYEDPFYRSDRWASVRAALTALRDTTATLGVPLTLVVLPERGQVSAELGARPNAELSALASRLGIDALDLLPALRDASRKGVETWHDIFEGHLSPDGHRVVAERIAAHLRESGIRLRTRRGASTPP